MKSVIAFFVVILFASCANAQQDAKVPSVAELASAHAINACTINASDGNGQKECEKRDTALLFLLLGKRETATRILCSSNVAIQAFRPEGALGSDKFNDSVAANKRCLEASGLVSK
jgi:hypothetical protein